MGTSHPPRAFALALTLFAVFECAPRRTADAPATAQSTRRCLVLYDDGGPYAWLGELYATGAAALVSHFGTWAAMPVSRYIGGTMRTYDAAIYVGSTYDQPLPAAFLEDVLADTTNVVWIGDNVWELSRRTPDFLARFGFLPDAFDARPVSTVSYKGARLPRRVEAEGGIMRFEALEPTIAKVLAWAEHDDGSAMPWALRAGRLTYVGEQPFAFVTPGDRFLVLADMLFDVLAPRTPERHRAVVRIEDVSPRSSPEALRATADHLAQRGVPFAVALIPVFEDPLGAESGGDRTRIALADAPEVSAAVRYMLTRGGTLVLHGYTHQYGTDRNPYSGATAADFEFYRAHLDSAAQVVLDGPVAEDSEAWATERVKLALAEVERAGLPRPRVFEYPHYAGSPADSRAIARLLGIAFQRELFFAGSLQGAPDTSHSLGLTFPFVVRDPYGWSVVPENLGNYVPVAFPGQPPTSPDELIARARALSVVRDGVAGFFFHPIFDAAVLDRIVTGIEAAGYSFVSIESLYDEAQ